MALTTAQYALLKTELQTDPAGLGYAAPIAAGSDNQVAALLNLVRAGVTLERASVTARDLLLSLAPTEYIALTQAQRDYIALLPAMVTVDIRTGSPLRNALNLVFSAGSASRTAYVALASRQGSRAEQVLGVDVRPTEEDVAIALRST